MFKKHEKRFMYGDQEVVFETGEIARQAAGAVKVSMGDTVVLVTVCAAKTVKEGQDFFPLTVDYFEKFYAAGKIPGGFLKREGKQSDREILISRLIDRPVRPLFPAGFYNDVQVVATVVSRDPEIESDIPAMLGASCALTLSGLPFAGPIGAARVGFVDGEFVLNPTLSQLEKSKLDLVVAGTEQAVLMVESEAKVLPEKTMLGAVMFGHEQMRSAIAAINELADEVDPELWSWEPPAANGELSAKLRAIAAEPLGRAFGIKEKQARERALAEIWAQVEAQLVDESMDTLAKNALMAMFQDLEKEIVRGRILSGEPRIDGRDTRTVRPIDIKLNVLPRAHGSALFTRGETQALVATTLGTGKDAQIIDNLAGDSSDSFIFQYNFPPYATGETGRMGSPKRREIGHGRLAKRGLKAVMPDDEDFNYTVRVVSDITESNGSSSMASVCGGCLSMLSAGIPLKAHVAGVAMGLILEGNKFAILTDILGDEDHLGDMDFKVAGTTEGVTALQMDIKIQGINEQIMGLALDQAKEARMRILGLMKDAIGTPGELSDYAPRLFTIHIKPEKIRDVIGKGGETIRAITSESGAEIDVDDDGRVVIASPSQENAARAIEMIENIVRDVEAGEVYEGKVTKIIDNNVGAIVSFMDGNKDGMVHVSQIAHEHVKNVGDYLKVGQTVKVKVLEIDPRGRCKLSIKALIPPPEGAAEGASRRPSAERPDRAPRPERRERSDRAPRPASAGRGRGAEGSGADPRPGEGM